jgi:hypothetical protein
MEEVVPFTDDERLPFTRDEVAVKAISNILVVGAVSRAEQEKGFLGWVVCGLRPLALSPANDNVLMYGSGATVFPTYPVAVDYCVRTYLYAQSHNYSEWFRERLRIFSVCSMPLG